jgi:NADPH:quinone reductase-like Zn-dependent oxidoreductase
MNAIALTAYGGTDVLQFKELPMPKLRPGDLIVVNRATGVNSIDFKVRARALGAAVRPD